MMPNVSDAFWDWTTPVILRLVTTEVVDFQAVETSDGVQTFDAVMEPIPPQKLLVKPEGQRTWKWWYLWTTYPLELDQIVADQENKQYRVMTVSDWRNGGHVQYEVVQNPPKDA